jgi:hypothetical protein
LEVHGRAAQGENAGEHQTGKALQVVVSVGGTLQSALKVSEIPLTVGGTGQKVPWGWSRPQILERELQVV